MAKKLYVGSLPYSVNNEELSEMFSKFGEVTSASIIEDRENNNRSKGFGFVEFADDAAANAAIEEMHDAEVGGRRLVVNEARPKEDRPARPSFGGGNRGGGNY